MKPLIRSTAVLTLVLIGLLFSATAFAAEVAQGECISYDKETKIIRLREYDTNFSQNKYGNPTSIISDFDVSTAKIGILPEPKDILRLSYVIEGNSKVAVKVMNVSKQDLMKK